MSPATSRAAGAFLASLGASEATVAAAERTTVAQTVKELFAVQGAPVREAGGGGARISCSLGSESALCRTVLQALSAPAS